MQHLRLRSKMALVIGILVLTAVAIAVVGILQLRSLNSRVQKVVDVSVKKQSHGYQMQLDLMRAIRAQKNSIISVKDDESKAYASAARKFADDVNHSRAELGKLVDQTGHPDEKECLADFDRDWKEFLSKENEALNLATQDSNYKASQLLNGRMAERAKRSRRITPMLSQADAEIADKPDPGRVTAIYQKSRQLADVLVQLKELHRLLARHIEAADDQEMSTLEAQLKAAEQAVDTGLASLKSRALPKEIASLDRSTVAFSEYKELTKQVLKLSRDNTTVLATKLSMGPLKELTDSLEQTRHRLKTVLDQRLEEDKQASQSAYTLSIWSDHWHRGIGDWTESVPSLAVTRSITIRSRNRSVLQGRSPDGT